MCYSNKANPGEIVFLEETVQHHCGVIEKISEDVLYVGHDDDRCVDVFQYLIQPICSGCGNKVPRVTIPCDGIEWIEKAQVEDLQPVFVAVPVKLSECDREFSKKYFTWDDEI